MIGDFDVVKKQLQDLSEIINCFKSEAVQLKVVELLIQKIDVRADQPPQKGRSAPPQKEANRQRKGSKKAGAGAPKQRAEKPRQTKGGRPGPGAILAELIATGFFKQPKTVQDIVDHCKSVNARTYTTSELCPALTRSLRRSALKRTKNEDHQYQYSE